MPAAAADFYADKQINMIVGSAVSGGYDTYARLVARHWPKHIPGKPTIIVQNMPAAGSLAAMNALANTAPRDGTTIGAVQNHVGIEPIMGVTGPIESMRFDGRAMNWIGSATKEIPVVAAWSNSPIKKFQDTFEREMVVGSSGTATADTAYPRILNATLGTKFRVIAGYKSANELAVAAERGETMGRAGWFVSGMLATQGQQIADGKIIVLVHLMGKAPGTAERAADHRIRNRSSEARPDRLLAELACHGATFSSTARRSGRKGQVAARLLHANDGRPGVCCRGQGHAPRRASDVRRRCAGIGVAIV